MWKWCVAVFLVAMGAGSALGQAGEAEASISVNGVRNAAIPRGWPVIIEGVYSVGSLKGLSSKLKVRAIYFSIFTLSSIRFSTDVLASLA